MLFTISIVARSILDLGGLSSFFWKRLINNCVKIYFRGWACFSVGVRRITVRLNLILMLFKILLSILEASKGKTLAFLRSNALINQCMQILFWQQNFLVLTSLTSGLLGTGFVLALKLASLSNQYLALITYVSMISSMEQPKFLALNIWCSAMEFLEFCDVVVCLVFQFVFFAGARL